MALVFAEHPSILWESEETMHVIHDRWDGDIRPMNGFTFCGSGANTATDAEATMKEVREALADHGLLGQPLG